MNLYIYSYNNYYNRIVKKAGDRIDDYEPFLHYGPVQGVYGFTPGDGINTQQVIGTIAQSYDGKGDYLIAHNPQTNEIDSRWFIVNTNRTRNGQWELTLHRDLIVDYYDIVIDSPMFIEKATLLPNDDLIFNREGLTVNQIKSDETLLQDETKCAWLVGYVTRSSTAEGQTATPLSASIKYNLDLVPHYIVNEESELPFNDYLNTQFSYAGEPSIDIFFTNEHSEVYFNSINRYGVTTCPLRLKANGTETGYGWITNRNIDADAFYYGADKQQYVRNYASITPLTIGWESFGGGNRYFAQYLYNAIPESSWTTLLTQIDEATGTNTASEISKYANKVVQIGENFYRTKITSVESDTGSVVLNQSLPMVEQSFRYIYNTAANAYLNDYPENSISSQVSTNISDGKKMIGVRTSSAGTVMLTLEPITDTKVTAKIVTDALATMCVDAPYDIITMPYSDTLTVKTIDGNTYTSNKQLALATMTALLAQEGGAGAVKDVQLLPYCPLRRFIDIDGNIDLTLSNEEEDFSTRVYYVTAEETSVKLIPLIYCQYSTDSFDIPYEIKITNSKMQNECDMYRLSSPNFASTFEFNAARNKGVTKFNVDYNYKPYSPYIHLNPNFNGLYGKDFDDPRGLICGGDFSITAITDAWEQYQLQNKNYEKTFQRQIENMEVQHEVARTQDIVGAITGTISGTASGALTGSMVGSGAIGAVVGGVASAVGGIADIALNEKLRSEALDYTKDMFGYQLGNIQALPNTIAKVSAFNRNNKIFPVLEYYTCTDREKEALANKIAWNGMSVGAIGTIGNYIGNTWSYNNIESKGYIKGQLIRMEFPAEHKSNLHAEDYRIVNAISGELYKGVYIK